MILDSDLILSRKKISEIYERKTITRRERNEYGDWQWIEKELLFKRPVNVVSSGTRLIHFLVDFYVVSFAFIIGTAFLRFRSDSAFIPFIPWIGILGHYIVGEFFFQKTLGKLLTRSIVVNEYGERPDFKTVVLRTFIRMLPFETFSFFGYDRGWHDSWTKTYVMRKSELAELQRLLQQSPEEKASILL